jgi:hypothetical protein
MGCAMTTGDSGALMGNLLVDATTMGGAIEEDRVLPWETHRPRAE